MKPTRRDIFRGFTRTVGFWITHRVNAAIASDELPEAERFRKEQSRVLAKYGLATESRFV